MYKDRSSFLVMNDGREQANLSYTASALPTLAQSAIHTPIADLDSGFVSVEMAEGYTLPVYCSAPKGKTNLPIIVVIQEIFGVHEYIADVTRRLAQQGYMAIAPDLYKRQGDATQYTDIHELLSTLVSTVPDVQVVNDIDAAVQWAAEHGGDIQRLGVTGFCWGGRQTWLYAAHNPKVKAAVAWYGKLVGQNNALQTKQPVEIVNKLHAPVLGLYGQLDDSIPLASIEQMQKALKSSAQAGNAAAKAAQFVIYPEAGHAFHADYRPSYHEASAKDGWQHLLDWFKQYV